MDLSNIPNGNKFLRMPSKQSCSWLPTQETWKHMYIHTKTHTCMFTAALFVGAQSRKNPNVYQVVNRQCVVQQYNGLLLSHNANTCNNTATSQTHYVKWKRPHSKDSWLRDSPYTAFWKRKNCRERKQISGFRGWGRGKGLTTKDTREFWGHKVLYLTCGGYTVSRHLCLCQNSSTHTQIHTVLIYCI